MSQILLIHVREGVNELLSIEYGRHLTEAPQAYVLVEGQVASIFHHEEGARINPNGICV
jgi:hypothetical protein